MFKIKLNKSGLIIILITSIVMFILSIIIYDSSTSIPSGLNISTGGIQDSDFDIYYMDSDYNESILTSLQISKDKSKKEALEILAKEISNKLFEGREIEIINIKDNIAYIDLKDNSTSEPWSGRFQGSTGATTASYNLIDNLLQEHYEGEWIDAVYLTYNGEIPGDYEYEHLGSGFFGSTIYRNPKHKNTSNSYVQFNHSEDYIDLMSYNVEQRYYIDINLDGTNDEVLFIYKQKHGKLYYDPMIYITDGSKRKLLTIIPIPSFNPRIDKITDSTGDGVPDIKVKYSSNSATKDSDILYKYEDGSYRADDIDFNEAKTKVSASSNFSSEFYDKNNISYKPEMVMDARPRTSWIEGAYGNGVDEWIKIDFGREIEVNNIYILNGLGDVTGEYYYKNHRVKKLLLEFSTGENQIIELEDDFIREQEVIVDNIRTNYIKFTIVEVYEGSKFDDTCIGSISINKPRIYNYSIENNSNKQSE